MWAPALFVWLVSSAGYLWWDPIVGVIALLAGPLVLAMALWPAWVGALLAEHGRVRPQWMPVVPRLAAQTAVWLWAVGWTFAMPNPILGLAAEVAPGIRDLPGIPLLVEFTRWAMNHPRYALPLFFLSGWCVAALWSLRRNGEDGTGLVRDHLGHADA